MIRLDRINKAYATMKPEELAAIAFQYLADTNEKGLDLVRRAVPWKSYKALDYDFRTRYDNLFGMASFFALEYWKTTALWLSAYVKATKNIDEKDFDETEESVEAVECHQVRLVSLVQAVETVCRELGIDPTSVWKIAGTDKLEMVCAGTINPVWVADYAEFLRALATGSAGSATPKLAMPAGA